jgi:hypothetical protein
MKKKLIALALVGAISISNTSQAQWAVSDGGVTANGIIQITYAIQQMMQLKEQYEEIMQQVQLAQNQVEKAQTQIENITGSYGMGLLGNSASDLLDRQWMGNDWEQTLKGISGGNNQRYQELRNAYIEQHQTVDASEFRRMRSEEATSVYKEKAETNQAVAAVAEQQYAKVNDYIDKLHELGNSIESPTNENTKSATDLNTRMIQELGYIMSEMVRMQSTAMRLQTATQAQNIQAQSSQAKFFN